MHTHNPAIATMIVQTTQSIGTPYHVTVTTVSIGGGHHSGCGNGSTGNKSRPVSLGS